jgi:hypothetical protein
VGLNKLKSGDEGTILLGFWFEERFVTRTTVGGMLKIEKSASRRGSAVGGGLTLTGGVSVDGRGV